jgi:hypothetical protein
MKHLIWLNLVLGMWLLASPFAFGYDAVSTAATWSDVVVGFAIIGCAWCVMTDVSGSALYSGCSVLAGAWLLVAPFALNYWLVAFGNDVIIGVFVLVIGAIETWRLTHRTPSIA